MKTEASPTSPNSIANHRSEPEVRATGWLATRWRSGLGFPLHTRAQPPWAIIHVLSLSIVVLVAGPDAWADVGPPVEIRMDLGQMRQAVSGEQYAGVFEVHVDRAGTLADFKLLGNGWQLLSLEPPGDPVLVLPGVVRIPFRAVPADADEPVGLSLTYNGRRVAKSAAVGPAHFARAGKPFALVRVPGPPAAAGDGADPDAKQGGEQDPPGEGSPIQLHFVGRIVYSRPGRDLSIPPDGDFDDPEDVPPATVGADNIDVRVWDIDTVGHEVIWSWYTDENGYFDTGVIDWDDPGDLPDLVLYCETEVEGVVDVTDNSWEEYTYTFQTGEIEDFEGSFHDFGWFFPSPPSVHPALHIFNNVVRTRRFIEEKPAYLTQEVQVEWPDDSQGGTGAWYESGPVEIHMSTERQWNNDTVSHEYGHHFMYMAYDPDPPEPDYCNGFCDAATVCTPGQDCPENQGHCMWCMETDHDAWGEGWPNWLADVVTRDYPIRYTHEPSGLPFVPLYTRSQESTRVCCQDDQFHDALLTEGFVGALLRDIEDQTQDDHDDDPDPDVWSFDGIFDLMCLGPIEIFRVTYLDQPITVTDFINAFIARYPQYTGELWPTAFNVGGPAYVSSFPPDTQPPGVVLLAGSPTHPFGEGGSLPCIVFEWWVAPDDVSGASAYSFLTTTDPNGEEPDEFAETVWGTATCSVAGRVEVWELGEHYFCVKAQDNAGNWSNQWATFGPFEITDCNGTGILDACDISCSHQGVTLICLADTTWCQSPPGCGLSSDCQPNLIPDECDIASGFSEDCNLDGIPDECQDNLVHWIAGSGLWGMGENWDGGVPPGPGEIACINVPGDVTVSHTLDARTVGEIACYENLAIYGDVAPWIGFTIEDPSFVLGNMTFGGLNATLTVDAALDVGGLFSWVGGGSGGSAQLSGPGTTYANGGVLISDVVHLDGHHLVLDGNSTSVTTTGRVDTIGTDSVFEIRPGSTYEHQGSGYILNGWLTDSFVNGGTLIKSVDPGESWLQIFTNNSGLIHVQAGTLVLRLGSTGTGDFLGDPGTTLEFGNRVHDLLAGSSIVGDDVMFTSQSGGSDNIGGTYNVSGRTTIVGHQVNFPASANIINYGADLTICGGPVYFEYLFGGPINFNRITITCGTAYFNSGDPINTATLDHGPGTIRGPSDITVSGLMTWNPGGWIMGPSTINANGGLLVTPGSSEKMLYDRVFNNAGTATLLGWFSMSSSAVFNNLTTATFDYVGDQRVQGGGGGTFNNAGLVVKSSGVGTAQMNPPFFNTGTVDVQSGELRFGRDFVQTAGQTILNNADIEMWPFPPHPMEIQGGLLTGAGTVTGDVQNVGGSVEPGLSAGMLVVDGDYTQGAGAALIVEIGGLIQGTEFDYLAVSGDASLAGTLDVELINEFLPAAGDMFEILTAANIAGTFDTVDLTDLPPGFDLLVIYTANSVILRAVPPPAPGDMNCDGSVDGLDVAPFVLALLDPMQYGLDFPVCRIDNGDINADTTVDTADVDPFVVCLLNGVGCP